MELRGEGTRTPVHRDRGRGWRGRTEIVRPSLYSYRAKGGLTGGPTQTPERVWGQMSTSRSCPPSLLLPLPLPFWDLMWTEVSHTVRSQTGREGFGVVSPSQRRVVTQSPHRYPLTFCENLFRDMTFPGRREVSGDTDGGQDGTGPSVTPSSLLLLLSHGTSDRLARVERTKFLPL